MGYSEVKISEARKDFDKVIEVLKTTPGIDKLYSTPLEEFKRRQELTYKKLSEAGFDVGFVFSDEHYNGDVPYLGGNTNIHVEQVAGAIGKTGFHIIAGLEGGYIAEQLAPRAGVKVHKVEMLQLADEKYPVKAERLEDVLEETADKKVDRIALLTPRQVIPSEIVEYLESVYGKENIVDAQEIYYKIKYIKSDIELRLIKDANVIADAMIRAMLAVLKPGMLETELASWAYFVGKQLGSEENGWDVIVGAGEANRGLIGKALNRVIHEGEYIHIGVAPKRDGLNSCLRRSVIVVDDPSKVTPEQKYWFDMVEGAFKVGYDKFVEVAENNLPARLQEQALVDYFASYSDEVSKKIGKKIDLENFKPYTGTHNAGYTECQEFYGAITLDSDEPLGEQIVMMLDVALRGIGDNWNDVVIPDFEYLVVENTLGKFGHKVENFNKVPVNVQAMVGNPDKV